jgi:hypothetical protein
MTKGIGKRIVPLRYDAWSRFTEWKDECFQILPTFTHQRVFGQREQYIRSRVRTKSCPVCDTPLSLQGADLEGKDETGTQTWYRVCDDCGFWRFHLRDNVYLPYYDVPHVKRFNYELETPSITYLSHEIQKHREQVFSMNPTKFERYVGSVLADFLDCEVRHIGQSGDDGVDLIALISDNPLMIQVKRRENPDKTEGIDVVKLLFASAFARGADSGMVVTSAKKFSRRAEDWIESSRLKDVGFNLELVDINGLMSMIDAVLEKDSPPPWLVHQRRPLNYLLSSEDDEWNLVNIADGDIVFRRDGENRCLVAFEHADLNKCYTMPADKSFESRLLPEMRFSDFKTMAGAFGKLEVLHDDKAISMVDSVPFSIREKLQSRWTNLFPEEVFDFS